MRLVLRLRKGEQLGLFSHVVTVKGHTRQTEHGPEHVAPHLRHQHGKAPPPAAADPGFKTKEQLEDEKRVASSNNPAETQAWLKRRDANRAERAERKLVLKRKKSRDIEPHPSWPAVADVTDPVIPPEEIHPAPGLDGEGTTYWVGPEREVWTAGGSGMGWADVYTADRRVLPAREAIEEMKVRGARIRRLVRAYGPAAERADIGSPLVTAADQRPDYNVGKWATAASVVADTGRPVDWRWARGLMFTRDEHARLVADGLALPGGHSPIYPYSIRDPAFPGQDVFSHNGRGFGSLKAAMAMTNDLAAGRARVVTSPSGHYLHVEEISNDRS